MKITDILQKSPLTISEVCDLLPSLTSNGDSVFHILARENYVELLTRVLKVAEFVSWRTNLSMLVHRYIPDSLLPIEEAICAKNIECVEIILHFMNISELLPDLLQDQYLLKNAVLTSDLDIVKVLISYGFHKGLQAAIIQAIKIGNAEILRVLLHYQTKVMNAVEFSHITDDQVRALHHSNGGIKWEGLELESIDLQWLYDCYDAVDSVSKACSLIQILLSGDDNHLFFHQLGQDCLSYFSRAITSQSPVKHPSYQLTMITRVNLNKNQLTEIPLELFQLPSLQNLTLSHNRLRSLPSSSDYPTERIYAAPISNLDLDHNELQTLPECLFRDLAHSLTELNVSWNSLSDLPPGLWVVPKLTVLKLAHNNLSQLHYFSDLEYFNDRKLSETVVGSCHVSNGVLVCKDASKFDSTSHELETYMHNLADFRNTVCAVKFLSAGMDQNTMSDMMGVHLARIEYFLSSEQQHPRTASTPTIQGECLFPVNNGEEKESTVSNLMELDLSHNKFCKFPWDLACTAPRLMKLYMQNNKIQDLDIVRSIPLNLESLFLDENTIANIKSDRHKSLPCGHPFRLLTVPEIDSHKRYCWHCKHRALERLSVLSLARNQLHDFPSVQIVSEALQKTDYNSYSYEALYPNLSILSLEHNMLQKFPGSLHHLTKLTSVKLSYNQIQELPSEVGLLNSRQLLVLKMDGMNIQNVPPHLLQKPSPKLLLNYLRAIQQK
jgi:Leucine-rich repeat (LRR) protein